MRFLFRLHSESLRSRSWTSAALRRWRFPTSQKLLSEGAEFCALGSAENWRWLLTPRPLFVLAPGESFGVCGHISVPKLVLGVEHTL